MRNVGLKMMLLALPFILAPLAHADESTLYNKQIRAAAGDLNVALVTLENAASKIEDQGTTESAANEAAMEAWNFKQLAGATNAMDYLKKRMEPLSDKVDAVRTAYSASHLGTDHDSSAAFIAVARTWSALETAMKGDVIPPPPTIPKPKS